MAEPQVCPQWAARLNLGGLLERRGDIDAAVEQWRAIPDDIPDAFKVHNNLGAALHRLGRTDEAIEHLRKAVRQNRDSPDACANLARLLVWHRDPSVRRGDEAVRLAERAASLTESRRPDILQVLAAAYAEAGRFEDAVRVTEHALRGIRANDRPGVRQSTRAQLRALAEEFKDAKRRYQAGRS